MPGNNSDFRKNSFPRKMFKTICSDCKQDCEMPFEPKQNKPVYCKECYPKHRR